MKRVLMILAVMVTAVYVVNAQEKTKTYKFGDIKSISAGYTYEIYVTPGATKDVKLVYDKALEDYIKVSHYGINSELVLRMDELPRKLRNENFSKVKVYLCMDSIDEIELSGAASILFNGHFRASDLELELTGASSVKGLEIIAESMSADCSGAATFDLKGEFKGEVEMELSGAVNGRFNGSGSCLEAELSGASDLDAVLTFEECDISCSGASNAELSGKSGRLYVEGSGACSVDAKNLTAEYASIELSGASKAKVNADQEIRYDVSKTCKMTYFGNAKLVNMSDDNNVVRGN